MPFVTSGQAGIDLSATTAGTTTDGASAVYKLGTVVQASDGSEWVYVQANGAVTIYDTVWVNSAFQAASITPALAITPGRPGFAQNAFTDNDFGWVMLRGRPVIRVFLACAVNVPLYTCNTAGVLDDSTLSLSHYQVIGVVTETSGSTSAASTSTAIANFPSIRQPQA